MFHFYNTFLNLFNISSVISVGIIIYSTGSSFSILSSFELVTESAILFPKNSSAFWATFSEVVFTASSPVSNNCFLYFLANDKSLTYFIVLGYIGYRRIYIY